MVDMNIIQRLKDPHPILLDGAINTELSRQGLLFTTQEWLRVNLDAPNVVANIHKAYARAGAEVHIANSFASARHVLEAAGMGDDYESINRAAVRLCREAGDEVADHQQWIAGSLSTYATGHDRTNLPALDILERQCAEQADILADAGCDMLALEMLFDVDTTSAMLNGALQAGLPVSIGLVCTRDDHGQVTLFGTRPSMLAGHKNLLSESLPKIIQTAHDPDRLIVSVMHSELEHTGPALAVIGQYWDGLTGAYPNNGHYRAPGGWDTSHGYSEQEFTHACLQWVDCGLNLVGGCCGVGPTHIGTLGQSFVPPRRADHIP